MEGYEFVGKVFVEAFSLGMALGLVLYFTARGWRVSIVFVMIMLYLVIRWAKDACRLLKMTR